MPLLVFVPVGASLVGCVVLLRYHPDGTPRPLLWTGLGLQLAAHLLTVAMWGRWQSLGPGHPLRPVRRGRRLLRHAPGARGA
ncbi:MAG TPA: hypothetical protein VIK73_09565 [Limnochordales bacterium]|uniref:Uncharacterized protein n=1 Tax=Geochorda subterranea TaxID=3109564 RepID=A0ABZ1BM09_9FIRM|nr:hypothetical protein [Limnochorda sp. LNt]WRP13774.1 hypothetical protein VLY81_10030 [Limnochorda sp. LNt]